jgi:DNA-binding NarL/FixJ family response regulator
MMKTYNIAIVDDHPIVTGGLQFLFSKLDDVKIIGCFNSGEEILKYDQLHTADIVLLDVFLPDINGIDLCLKLKKLYPKLIILAMSSQAERGIVLQMMQNGAGGYLLKSAAIEEFHECIRQSTRQNPVFSHEVRMMMDKSNEDVKNIPRLTRREREVLLLLIDGMQTQEISETLFLSFLTVQTHRRNLLNKFHVKNVIELINFAKSNNLL